MRLYTDHANEYIAAVAASIIRDPASFDNWRCLRIHPKESEEEQSLILNSAHVALVRDAHKNLDCDVIHASDGDLLIISRELNAAAMQQLADAFTIHLTADKAERTMYDISRAWREMRAMLLVKLGGSAVAHTPTMETENFGEVESLREVFAEAKKLRKARMPQHVMIVEDDALTRKMVASVLKEKFAMITAHDAHEAVANYLLFAPDIVFLDIGLPDASGFAALNQIMEIDPEAYVVMFSGNSYLDNVTKALTGGASGFVAKPFRQEKLRHYIANSATHYNKSA